MIGLLRLDINIAFSLKYIEMFQYFLGTLYKNNQGLI